MNSKRYALLVLHGALLSGLPAAAQMAGLRPAVPVQMPAQVDSNSPAFWRGREFRIINSAGVPAIGAGNSQFDAGPGREVAFDTRDHFPMWIEAAWTDSDGTLFAWYHHEPFVCGGELTLPLIGALVSFDGGESFTDLGPVLTSGAAVDCGSQNGFFAGGHGDFSVAYDSAGGYFYFLFGNYGGPSAEQGVAIARMAFDDRFSPAGRVWKYFGSEWNEPGLGGSMTPIFRAGANWQRADTEAFWGPSIHWNTFLESWVVLLNHVCCRPKWPQEGVYISFNPDLGNPEGWTSPERLLPHPPAYYPQVLGLGPGETDSLAGETARFYLQGVSVWEIVFRRTDPWTDPEAESEDQFR